MSNAPDSRECPHCGGGMLFRLNEYQCTACGHFQKAVSQPDFPTLQPGVAEHIRKAAKDQPFALPAAASSLVTSDQSLRRAMVGNWLKVAFLVIGFCEYVAAGLLVQYYDPNVGITGGFIRITILGALLLTGFAALTLYVDWRGFRIFVLIMTFVILAAYIAELAMVWSGKHQLPLLRLTADMIILGWFAILNSTDIIKKV